MNNKIAGGLVGLHLGDALGAPHECLHCVKNKQPYTGILQFNTYYKFQYQQYNKTLGIGQVTDDTEMTIELLESIYEMNGYNRENTIRHYVKWANTKSPMIGVNTKQIFHGYKHDTNNTIAVYERHMSKQTEPENKQSNGCLMRSFPLMIDPMNLVPIDTALTNNNQTSFHCVFIQTLMINRAVKGENKESILNLIYGLSDLHNDVVLMLNDIKNNVIRNVAEKPGDSWVVNALYVSIYCFKNTTSFKQGIDTAVMFSGDSDTNACITGALLGSFYGLDEMTKDQTTTYNISKILEGDSVDLPRPDYVLTYEKLERYVNSLNKLIK